MKDIARAKKLYGKLLADPVMDIGLVPNGHASGMMGAVAFWHIEDIQKTLRSLLDAGAQSLQSPKDVGGGKLVRRRKTRTAT